MPDFSSELTGLITELDAAVEAHMEWMRRAGAHSVDAESRTTSRLRGMEMK